MTLISWRYFKLVGLFHRGKNIDCRECETCDLLQ